MQLNGFQDFSVIAEGGMAVLYRAVQTSLSRPVAIKVLKAQMLESDLVRSLFEREATIIARLDHPNVIRVIDRGMTSDGMPYFVMDFVEGKTLKDLLREGRLSQGEKLRTSLQIAKALAYAHKNNIIHRDIKPGNILIDGEGNVRVVDFGISLLADGEGDTSLEQNLALGTLAYMAPEQRQGSRFATAASDIYSLGVMMYLMFTGLLPKAGDPPRPQQYNSGLPDHLDQLIMDCIASDPLARITADKLVAGLLDATNGEHLTSREIREAEEVFTDPKQKFRLLDVIRESSYGAVYLYENQADHSLMVLKKRIGSLNGYHQAEKLAQHPHSNIVNIRGVTRNDRIFIIVMEYLAGGSLQNLMARTFSQREFLPIAEQICDAMIFAHQHRIVHGNLRPHNILFDEANHVKLTDFGMDRHYLGKPGEEWYSVDGEFPSMKADIFSAGVIFFQMLTGHLPAWRRQTLASDDHLATLPRHLQSLLRDMLHRDMDSRLGSFSDVLVRLENPGDPVITVAPAVAPPTERQDSAAPDLPTTPERPDTTPTGHWLPWVIGLFVLLNLLLLGGWWLAHST